MKDMENFSRLVHKTKKETIGLLQKFVTGCDRATSAAIDWTPPVENVGESIATTMNSATSTMRKQFEDLSERIHLMSRDAGLEAARSHGASVKFPDQKVLPDNLARMLWLYVEYPRIFCDAEEARYAIEYRMAPKVYSGFSGTPGLLLAVTEESKAKLAEHIASLMQVKSNDIAVTDFVRVAPNNCEAEEDDSDEESAAVTLYQFTVVTNKNPNSYETVVDKSLKTKYMVPSERIRLTYEPATGFIEVYSKAHTLHKDIARAFGDAIMGLDIAGDRLPIRSFDLDSFKAPRDFPAHGEPIGPVRVTQIKLERKHLAAEIPESRQRTFANYLDIRIHRNDERSIWAAALADFGIDDLTPYDVKQVKLLIEIPKRGERRKHGLSVQITLPCGCSNGRMSNEERELRDRMLDHWGIINEF
jgi:hypothetical protein